MRHVFIEDYLFGEDLEINLLGLKKECREIEALIIKNAKPTDAPKEILYDLKTTSLYSQYNVFTYSGSTIQSLYKKIKQSVMPFLSDRNDT